MPLFAARLSDDHCISLYNGTSFKVCIYSPERIVGYSIVQEACENDADPHWRCYLFTEDGKLYRVHQDMLKGHRIGETSPVHDDDEIFSDLLCAEDKTDSVQLQRASQLVLVLESNDIILSVKDRPVGLCSVDKLIIVTTQHDQVYTVAIYNTTDDSCDTHSDNLQTLTNPVRTFTFPTDCLEFKHRKYNNYTLIDEKRILMKVVGTDFKKDLPSVCSDYVSVGISLYKHLFGHDMALSEVHVLLLAPPRGSIYFLPLNSHIIDTHQSLPDGGRSVAGSWRLLCETSTPVVDVGRMALSACKASVGDAPCESCTGTLDQNTEAQDAIVLCCSDGALKVFHHDRSTNKIIFSSVVVRDPVIAVCSYHSRLYHSTGKHLYETVVHCVSRPNMKTRVAVSSSQVFHHAGVTALSCRTQDGCIDHAASPCTLVLSLDSGEMKQLSSKNLTDRCGGHGWESRSDGKVVQSGTIIRDTLRAIEHVDTAQNNAQKQLDTQSYWLTQVSTIAYLLRLDVRHTSHPSALEKTEWNRGISRGKNTSKMPFRCVFKSRVAHSDSEITIYLDGEITSLMPASLTPDWSLQLTLVPSTRVSGIPHVTKTQRLSREMKNGDSLILSVPVSPRLILGGFEMLASAVLSVPADQWFPGQAGDPGCLSADIGYESIDMLYFMLPDTTVWQHKRAGLQEEGAVYRCVQTLARNRPAAAALLQDTTHETRPGQTDVRCKVFVDKEVYRQLEESNGTGVKGVFDYLLASSECGSMAGTSTDCRLVTVLGHPVRMNVTASPEESTGMGREIITVSVTVTADIDIAACIHKAVLQKLQALGTSHRPDVHVRDVRKLLEQAQDLERLVMKMQQANTPCQSHQMVTLYQQLRSVHL